jgi:hypothetical protein
MAGESGRIELPTTAIKESQMKTRKVYQVRVVLIEVELREASENMPDGLPAEFEEVLDVDYLLEDEIKGAPVSGNFETKEEAEAYYKTLAVSE